MENTFTNELDELELLKSRMTEQRVSLLLGAGFSAGAKNQWNRDIPLGEELSKQLYHNFYEVNVPEEFGEEYIANVSLRADDLGYICTLLSSEKRKDKRNAYLTNIFKGCRTAGDKTQKKLTSYHWHKIFSLNIDDLVENIYNEANQPLCTWNFTYHEDPKANEILLVKLHGDVNRDKDGYVFDQKEYTSFIVQDDCLMREFAHCFLESDMVILGTSFQEEDLSFIIETYEKAGYEKNGHHYFFVTPHMNNLALRNEISNTENFHWIHQTTKEFLQYIYSNIVVQENSRNLLKEQGGIFLDEIPIKYDYDSKIYLGRACEYNDFFNKWDVLYPEQKELLTRLLQKNKPIILTLFGKPYVGKTTVAKRFLVDLKNRLFLTLELTKFDRTTSTRLKEFLTTLDSLTRVAILIENAAYQYDEILKVVKEFGTQFSAFIIITTDTTENHKGKNHIFCSDLGEIKWHELSISEEISPKYALEAFKTLDTKHRLNNFLNLIPKRSSLKYWKNRNKILTKMREINDIIDVLYFSSEGMYFKDHYSAVLTEKGDSIYYKYIVALCALCRLGISQIPTPCVAKLVPSTNIQFRLSEMLSLFPDIISEYDGVTRLLRQRIISDVIASDFVIVKDAIGELVKYVAPLCSETDGSQYFEYLEKALRVKRIKNEHLLNNSEILSLFHTLEPYCNRFSYFWVQYGLVAQMDGDYATARNHFLYAKRLHPNSYQVAHALAKNKMEIGISQAKKDKRSGDDEFLAGCDEMSELICSPFHSKAFNYSVHAFAHTIMRYYKVKDEIIPQNLRLEIYNHFGVVINNALNTGAIEKALKVEIIKFDYYCKQHKLSDSREGLDRVQRIHDIDTNDDNY